MKIAVSPANGRISPLSCAANSKSRSDVVPTATMRPPRALTALSCIAVSADTLPHSECILCSDVSSAFTGRNVPAPTCSVTKCCEMPRASSVGHQFGREMQPRRRRSHRSFLAGEHGLVSGAIALVWCAFARDVRRQRHIAEVRDGGVEVGAVQRELELDLARLAFRDDGGVEHALEADLALRAEAHAVTDLQALGRPRKCPPAAVIEPLRQQGINVGRYSIARTPPGQRCRDDASVVEDQRIAGSEQRWQVPDGSILKTLRRSNNEHPRSIPRARRMQGNPVLGQVEIE